jgi:hypothetical protein
MSRLGAALIIVLGACTPSLPPPLPHVAAVAPTIAIEHRLERTPRASRSRRCPPQGCISTGEQSPPPAPFPIFTPHLRYPKPSEWLLYCIRSYENSWHSHDGGAYGFQPDTWRPLMRRHRPAWVHVQPWTLTLAEQSIAASWLYQERGLAPWSRVAKRNCSKHPPMPRGRA